MLNHGGRSKCRQRFGSFGRVYQLVGYVPQRADSFLERLSDTEFDQGMAALRAHRANIDPAEAVTDEIDWFVLTKRA